MTNFEALARKTADGMMLTSETKNRNEWDFERTILSALNEAVKEKDEALENIRSELYHRNDLQIVNGLRTKLKRIVQKALLGEKLPSAESSTEALERLLGEQGAKFKTVTGEAPTKD